MVHAFVLIRSFPGKDKAVQEAVLKVKDVKELHPVAGPYDAVAVVDVPDLKAVGELIYGKIRMIEGVNETLTLVSVR